MKVYLASPYGFAASTRTYLEEIKSVLERGHVQVIDPWEIGKRLLSVSRISSGRGSQEGRRALHLLSSNLGEINQRAIDDSDVVVAGLDGPDVDSGTASEIGYAFAKGKRVFGLRSDMRRSGENEGVQVNLQVQYWIEASGGRVVESVHELLPLLNDPRPGTPADISVARPPSA